MNINLLNKPYLGKFHSKARIIKSVFSLSDAKAFLKMFWKVIPIITVLSLQNIRVTPRLRHMNKFILYIYKIHLNHGDLYTVLYLKSCHIAIQRYISGRPCKSLHEITKGYPWPKLIGGLPHIIASNDRREIRNLNPRIIRWWLSVLSIFRVLDAPCKGKLNTITDEYTGSYAQIGNLMFTFNDVANLALKGRESIFKLSNLSSSNLRASIKAGPNSSLSFTSTFTDLGGFFRNPIVLDSFREYARRTKSFGLLNLFETGLKHFRVAHNFDKDMANQERRGWLKYPEWVSYLIKYPKIIEEYDPIYNTDGSIRNYRPSYVDGAYSDIELGRVVGIPEPAGKLRVIALVDIWTQSLFEPLHKTLFQFLRTLPNDGTFDQNLAFERALEKASQADGIYCADLSAATDRLPIKLQADILNKLFRRSIGTYWSSILIDRSYILRETIGDVPFGTKLKYGVGQPMGCLSSWAMLAVCHHFILQACCQELGWSKHVWHTSYEILGDDIVIFDKSLYLKYIEIMTFLGVETNPNKSILSDYKDKKVIEFAKRTALNGVEVSGLSWKQLASMTGWKDLVPYILTCGDRNLISSQGTLIRLIFLMIDSKFRKNITIGNVSIKYQKHIANVVLSLLNHFSLLGMMDLKNIYRYVVDTRLSAEGHPITGAVPLTTMVFDLFECFKALPSFRKTGYFDSSKFRVNSIKFRDYLVEAKLLPFWGHKLDQSAIVSLERMRYSIPDFPVTICHHLIGWPRPNIFGDEGREFQSELYDYCIKLSESLLYKGKDDYTTLNELSKAFKSSLDLQNRDIYKTLLVQDELNVFCIKYQFITKLFKENQYSLKVIDKVPWPMKEVRDAVIASTQFEELKEEFGVTNLSELSSDNRLLVDFLAAQETFVLCDDFEFEAI